MFLVTKWCYEWVLRSLLLWMSGHSWQWHTKVYSDAGHHFITWCIRGDFLFCIHWFAWWVMVPHQHGDVSSTHLLLNAIILYISFLLFFGAEEPSALLRFATRTWEALCSYLELFTSSRAKGLHAAHLSSSEWRYHFITINSAQQNPVRLHNVEFKKACA